MRYCAAEMKVRQGVTYLHGSGNTVELDTETLDLDLVIYSPQVLQLAIREPSAQVASVEHESPGNKLSR